MVAVAQLVEPQIVVLVVAGSSPVGHPNFVGKALESPNFELSRVRVPSVTPTPPRRLDFAKLGGEFSSFLSKSSSVVAVFERVVYASSVF